MKYLSKSFYKDNFIQTLLSLCLQKIDDPAVFRIFMSKLQIRDLENECDAIVQILGNHYLQTGFYELCINTLYKLYSKDKTNPLYNLLMGIAFLQDSNSRTTYNKADVLKRAFKFFNAYMSLRKTTHVCESYSNMASAFCQISMFKEAIPLFEKVIQIHFERMSMWSKALGEAAEGLKENKCDNLWKKAAYNLVIVHKQIGNHEIAKQYINDFFTL